VLKRRRGGSVQGEVRLSERLCALYRDTSLIRKRTSLGPYRRPVPRVLGGWAFSFEQGACTGAFLCLYRKQSRTWCLVVFGAWCLVLCIPLTSPVALAPPQNCVRLISPTLPLASHECRGGARLARPAVALIQGYLAHKKNAHSPRTPVGPEA